MANMIYTHVRSIIILSALKKAVLLYMGMLTLRDQLCHAID